ncbi:hypothetical protein JHK82_018907 [Glycine max]|nr:hypothetical protein JHK82_018907 [Glycine max]
MESEKAPERTLLNSTGEREMEKSKTRGKREGSRTLPDSTGARKEGRMKDRRVVRFRGESTRLRCTQR